MQMVPYQILRSELLALCSDGHTLDQELVLALKVDWWILLHGLHLH